MKTFKEWLLQEEVKQFYAVPNGVGGYIVNKGHHPEDQYNFTIDNGTLNLPPALERDKENVLDSYYKKFMPSLYTKSPPPESSFAGDWSGNTMDPKHLSFRKPDLRHAPFNMPGNQSTSAILRGLQQGRD